MHHEQLKALRISGMALAFAILLSSAAPAENITYPVPNSTLFDAPYPVGFVDALAPSGSSAGKSNDLSGNVLTVNSNASGVYLRYVIGGLNVLDENAVTNNTVILNNNARVGMSGGYGGSIYGGYVRGTGAPVVTVSGNKVFLNDSASVDPINTSRIYGGYGQSTTGSVIASGNSVTISTSGNINNVPIAGGAADAFVSAIATGNHATLNNGAIGAGLVGGEAYSTYAGDSTRTAEATYNTATVNNGTVNNLIGGNTQAQYAGTTQIASGNTATLIDGAAIYSVYGGRATNGAAGKSEASSNAVMIRDSIVRANGAPTGSYVFGVIGGWAQNTGAAAADHNAVEINGNTTLDKSVYGGYANSSSLAAANSNTVDIHGNTSVNKSAYTGNANGGSGSVHGGYAVTTSGAASALNNTATIHGGKVDENVYGGHARSSSGSATAGNNTATISRDTVNGNVYGGYAAAASGAATASSNTMNITGGAAAGSVYGGHAAAGASGAATASNNTMNITGGAVTGNVYGGYAADGASGSAEAIGNTITIIGNPLFGANTILHGGFASGGDAFTGNTFNLHSAGLTVAGLQNFENLNFYIPASLASGGTMLNVTGKANIDSSTVGIGIDGAHSPLHGGDYFVLIDAANGGLLDGQPANDTAYSQVININQGATLQYEFIISTDNVANQLWAYLPSDSNPVTPESESLSKGFLAGMSLLNQIGDLIAGWGMNSALNAAGEAALRGDDPGAFAAISGGKSRYDTGCHVDLSSVAFMTGLARRARYESGNLMAGAFFEYGTSSYDAYSSVHGQGSLYNFGGGVIGRMDFRNNFHVEGSARMGRVRNSYRNSEIIDAMGREVQYHTASMYYGVHLGSGYTWNMTEKAKLDFFGKYFWTLQEGDTDRLPSGEVISFDGINSHRVRGGARFAYIVNETHNVAPYIGAAYEHEFGGDATATTNGYAVGVPSLEGGTGIGEIGLAMKPSKRFPLSIDLGVQGYTGTREGVSGILHIHYYF